MRPDMAKVIVERPRAGGGLRYPRGSARGLRCVPLEDTPPREGIRRPWTDVACLKRLNENLAPLRRFLLSNVGRPWNKVFSEICEYMDVSSAVQLHIWQHLKRDVVCLNPILNAGRWERREGWPPFQPFLVDPRCCLLRKNEHYWRWKGRARRRRHEQTRSPNFLAADKDRCYRMIDDIWYEFQLAPLPSEISGLFDAVLKCRLSQTCRSELIRLHGGPFYATSKRQLNSRELRRLRLPNRKDVGRG